MVTQFVYESEPDADGNVKSGVDANPLTLFYSVVLSLWSVGFLSSWKRTEANHAFLWGSEGIEDFELPRPQVGRPSVLGIVVSLLANRNHLCSRKYPISNRPTSLVVYHTGLHCARPLQFEGVVQVNKETGHEELVYGNAVRRLCPRHPGAVKRP
jgi:hypothetical protein